MPTKRTPAKRRSSVLRPIPGTPSERHNPAVTAAFKRKGFSILNTGGNVMVYSKSDPTIGEVGVIDAGDGLPLSMRSPVDVFFMGTEHSEALIEMHFPSASAFLATIRGR